MNLTLTFTPDGTGCCLYSELIDLARIGRLSVKRATRIEYDNAKQVWRVYDVRDGFPMFTAPTRQQCLEWEALHLQSEERMRDELQYGPDPVAAGTGIAW